jgi:hypothetical protein
MKHFARKKKERGEDAKPGEAAQPATPPGSMGFVNRDAPERARYALALTGDDPLLLRMLVQSWASKEGFTVKQEDLSKRGEYRLHFYSSTSNPHVLFECVRTPDDQYRVQIRRLRAEGEAGRIMAFLVDFIPKWYQELQRSFFHS